MKKNFLYSVMALFMCLFVACSQEEIISESGQGGKVVRMTVGVPGGATTRAIPSVEGSTLRCIMQVVDASNKAISGEGMRQVQEVNAEKITFTFTAPNTDYKCLFWADFVSDVKTDNIYNTTNLANITYNKMDNSVFSAAADAFCGFVADGTNTIQLKRPFAKVSVTPNNASNFSDYNKLTVSYDAPNGFNMVTRAVGNTPQKVTFTNSEFNASNGAWFSGFIFAPANVNKLNSAITMKLEGASGSKTLTIEADRVPLTENYEINGKFDAAEGGSSTSVEVSFDDSFIDPNAPVAMKIGDYINKDGSHSATYDAEKAIGIVFALGGKTDDSEYGESKTIAGYAMGLTSTPRTSINIEESKGVYTALPELTNTSANTSAPWIDGDYNGYAYTAAFTTMFNDYASPLLAAFETWKGKNEISSAATNLSTWYIPSSRQLADLIGAAYGYDGSKNDQQVTELNIPAIAKNEAVAKAVTTFVLESSSYFGSHTNTSNILSSFIRGGRFMCIQTTYSNSAESINQFTGVTVKTTAASPFAIRPVLTIFATK